MIVIDADHIQLADPATSTTPITLLAGATLDSALHLLTDTLTIDFAPTSPTVDTTTSTIQLTSHGLTSGDTVSYSSEGGDAIGGLSDDSQFAVIVVGDNQIQLAELSSPNTPITLSDGATGANHSLTREGPL